MVKTLSHSTCSTARLFILKSLFDKNPKDKYIIITDSESDITLMQSFAKVILKQELHQIGNLAELWITGESTTGIFTIPTSLLETHGSLEYLKKHSLYTLKRGSEQTLETTIEKLIEFGYTHAHHPGELATYRREGSIVTITDAYTGNTIHIEWFDTEIDSIIEIDSRTDARNFRESISIKNQILESTPVERKIGTINMDLLDLIGGGNKGNLILVGGDFLPYIDFLREKIDIHFTDFHREDSLSLGVDIPSINHIDEFLGFLRDNTDKQKIQIYTKFTKTVEEFVEFHKLTNIEIIEVQKGGMESCTIPIIEVEEQKMGVRGEGTVKNFQKKISSGDEINDMMSNAKNGASLSTPETFGTFGYKSTEKSASELIIITDDIIGQIFVRTRNKKSIAKHLDLLLSLKPGNLVVHREHGIALFHSVVHKNTGNLEREYLELHYAEGDKLFVPLTEIYRVSKYLGKPDVELTKLSGKEWERTMEKTTEEIEAIAMDILETNARRSLAKGRSFAKFREKEIEFKNAFAHEYTHDQSSAIDEIFEDMESDAAMDRLISGDVGFGKTEVAMNAIYKAVLSGTQVAVISPLLVLADEHYETFVDRLTPFGVRIGIMTRMNSAREITQTLEELKNGNIDVVVGTHRLLSEDVKYKKLGLLVIDEEHKFGVTHKERIKKIRAGIDILALSATPIPRSLNLALSGLKKISIIATPPKKKKPIETIITRWDESVIAHAIRYEIDRGGQVIILHNRIRGMESLMKEIEEIVESGKLKVESNKNSSNFQKVEDSEWGIRGGGTVGAVMKAGNKKSKANIERVGLPLDAFDTFGSKSMENCVGKKTQNKEIGSFSEVPRIIITHGQMPGDQIEDRIHAFKKGEYNILLSTTIIENGVNFLRANTIIIIDPEEFGLASLHQLRGRVGRRDADAYCYLMYRKPELAKDEKERLITIANNTHLGAGFEIAMRDMEIRGAGDVLGIKQSGRSKDIGLTLYFRLLEERIAELRDEKKKRTLTKIELDISYILPEEYFLSEGDKLNFFREIENLETLEELEDIESEVQSEKYKVKSTNMNQEFLIGDTSSFSNLFLLVRSRLILSEYNVIKLSRIGLNYVFDLSDSSTVTDTKRFLERFDTGNRMILLSARKIRIETKYWKNITDFLTDITLS